MKRRQVLKKLQLQAKKLDLEYVEAELTNHTGVSIGGKRSTLGRHGEIDEVTARKFWSQFDDVLGKGWWR